MGVAAGSTYRFAVLSEPFGSGVTDPTFEYDPTRDKPYLLSVNDNNNNTSPLYESSEPNFADRSLVASDITPELSDDVGSNIQNYVKRDGTYYVFTSENDTDAGLYTGDSLANLTRYGVTLPGGSDCGAWEQDGTWYLFVEGEPYESQPSSDYLRVNTASDPTGPWNDQGVCLDVSGEPWHTGDPNLQIVNGELQMFIDNSEQHPNYRIARCTPDSSDLLSWSVEDEQVTFQGGGDFDFQDVDGQIKGFVEFAGNDAQGIGYFEETHMTSKGYRVPMCSL
ncbi:hypothetical protein C5B91_20220 [Haloferax sp. Atlit-10N]|uniref:hypothetical protein n=1 Tax=unclassified Haloferax TaxID=2625095 RepID=UPI000E394002|nr:MULTISPECIES: hypothetical protein [unclassified Haloferax]RDZ53935.1 hypothetical protein C5B91_20220 [Haloferax sp. Atlit-10N]